jgi:DNA recombination protein RmuC
MENVSGFEIVLFAIALVAIGALFVAWRRAVREAPIDTAKEDEMNERLAEVLRAQSEMTGRMQTMAEVLGDKQSQLLRGLSDRMDGLGHRLGQSMTDTTRHTHDNLTKLNERLAVIDTAQKNIMSLSTQVVELQKILANKQTRGAFGQARMEAIVRDGLPMNSYAFQHTLPNGTRPDCVVFFPLGPCLAIDAKFPLEAWNALRDAATPEAAKAAEAQFRRDTSKHVQDIASRYLVAGDTQDTAFMFVPSESVFADLHERFEDIVQKARRMGVVVVSPSLLMLAIQLTKSLMRDQRMREQAHVIQQEVGKLMDDVGRLGERVKKLQAHFVQANGDVEDILKSAKGVMVHGTKIARVEFTEGDPQSPQSVTPSGRVKQTVVPAELPFHSFDEVANFSRASKG